MRPFPLGLILPAAFLGSLAVNLFNAGSVFWLEDVHHQPPWAVGAYAAASLAGYIAGCFFLRDFHRRLPPLRELAAVTAGLAGTMTLIASSPGYGQAVLLNAAQGLLTSCFWPPLMGLATVGRAGASLGRSNGWYNLAWSSAVMIAPVLAGRLEMARVALPLLAGAVGMLLLAFVFLVLEFRHPAPATGAPAPEAESEAPSVPSEIDRRPAWVASLSMHLLVGIALSVIPVFARHETGATPASAGALLLIRSLATTVTFVLMSRFVFWHRNRPALLGLQGAGVLFAAVAAGCAWGVPTLASSYGWTAALMAALGVLVAASYAYSLYHSADGSRDPARGMALHEVFLSAGILAGSLGGGILYGWAGLKAVWLAVASVLVLTGVALGAFRRRRL